MVIATRILPEMEVLVALGVAIFVAGLIVRRWSVVAVVAALLTGWAAWFLVIALPADPQGGPAVPLTIVALGVSAGLVLAAVGVLLGRTIRKTHSAGTRGTRAAR